MSKRLERFLERLSDADTPEALREAVLAARDIFDVGHIVFHASTAEGAQWSATTYDPGWVRTYVEENFQTVDPVVRGCLRGFVPQDWKRLDWTKKAARKVMAEGMANGVGNQGYSVPVRGPSGQFAVFTVNDEMGDDAWAAFKGERRHDLLLAGHYINEKVMEVTAPKAHAPHQELSPRERDVLTHLARGANRGRAAEALDISEHTLRAYVESARFKLGAANVTHAVASAMSRGLICV